MDGRRGGIPVVAPNSWPFWRMCSPRSFYASCGERGTYEELGWEGALTDSGGVGLDDAPDGADLLGADAET